MVKCKSSTKVIYTLVAQGWEGERGQLCWKLQCILTKLTHVLCVPMNFLGIYSSDLEINVQASTQMLSTYCLLSPESGTNKMPLHRTMETTMDELKWVSKLC